MHRDQVAIHPCLRPPLTHHSTSLLHHAHTEIYTRSGTMSPHHMLTNRTCNLVVLVLLLIGARLALSPTLVTVNTAMAMAMAMVVTDDDVGLVRGDS